MYQTVATKRSPVTVSTLAKMKAAGEKIACLTAYDASFAAVLDAAGVDLLLVGDSLGMVIQGLASTLPVTMDEMVYHTRLVARGTTGALLVADLPFASYITPELAMRNAARLMQEGGAQMVKLEGGAEQAEVVAYLSTRGVPICAHIGLQPQFVHKLGGYRVQGRGEAGTAMLKEAQALVEAGADLLLLECVPAELACQIRQASPVPVIGIGAGVDVDGQILVLYDILSISLGKRPKFSKNFLADAGSVAAAVEAYVRAVKEASFPTAEHSF